MLLLLEGGSRVCRGPAAEMIMSVFLPLGRADQLQLYIVLALVEAGIQMSVRLRGHLRRLQVHLWLMVRFHIHIRDLRLVLIFVTNLRMSPL